MKYGPVTEFLVNAVTVHVDSGQKHLSGNATYQALMGDACGRETIIGRVTPHIRRVIQRMPLGSDRIRMLGGLDFTKEFVLKTCANDQKR
jgi:hypothetical protein